MTRANHFLVDITERDSTKIGIKYVIRANHSLMEDTDVDLCRRTCVMLEIW